MAMKDAGSVTLRKASDLGTQRRVKSWQAVEGGNSNAQRPHFIGPRPRLIQTANVHSVPRMQVP